MKLVFFGDSITEAGRDLSDPTDLGEGYVKIAAGKLRPLFPDVDFEILNFGVGGDRTVELLARVGEVTAVKPDVVVLEVGVNDVWRRFTDEEIVTEEQFGRNYSAIVDALKECGAKIILVEPYVLDVKDKRRFRPYLNTYIAVIREIARRENLPLVPLDEIFNGVTRDIKPAEFAEDGVHPTHRGCRYIADLIIKELKKFM